MQRQHIAWPPPKHVGLMYMLLLLTNVMWTMHRKLHYSGHRALPPSYPSLHAETTTRPNRKGISPSPKRVHRHHLPLGTTHWKTPPHTCPHNHPRTTSNWSSQSPAQARLPEKKKDLWSPWTSQKPTGFGVYIKSFYKKGGWSWILRTVMAARKYQQCPCLKMGALMFLLSSLGCKWKESPMKRGRILCNGCIWTAELVIDVW